MAGLRELDPGARALLGLASRHRVSDAQLARLMGIEAADLTARREAAIAELASGAALQGAFARSEVAEALSRLRPRDWSAGGTPGGAGTAPEAPQEEVVPAEDDVEPTAAPEPEPAAGHDGRTEEDAETADAERGDAEAATDATDVAPEVGQDDPRRAEEGPAWDEASRGRAEDERKPVAAASGGGATKGRAAASTPRARGGEQRGPGIGGKILAGLVLLLVAGALIFGFTRSGGSEDDRAAGGGQPAEPAPPPAAEPRPEEQAAPSEERAEEERAPSAEDQAGEEPTPRVVRLRPVGGTSDEVRGTVRVTGDRLRVRVSGLPEPTGVYEVWLYSSIGDAVSLGRSGRGSFSRTFRPRGKLSGYRFLDISLEAPGEGAAHSGQSVLRAPTGRLRAK